MYYFASDIHLGGGTPERARSVERRFVAWLDAVAADAEAIFLLGDLFDFWFEYRRVVPKGHVRVLGRLAGLTDRGVRVVFFTGNHDMWVGDYLAAECGVEVVTAPRLVELAGRRLFLAHGDNMNVGRKPLLRLMNALFRSRVLRWLFAWLVHPDCAVRFGRWWSGKSRKSHAGEPLSETLTDPLVEYARAYSRDHEVDCCIFGHMHIARDFREAGLRTLHLGAWEPGEAAVYAAMDDRGEIRLKQFPI